MLTFGMAAGLDQMVVETEDGFDDDVIGDDLCKGSDWIVG